MSDSELSIEELLARAKLTEAGVKQEREDRAEEARQVAVAGQVEKLYAGREEEVKLLSGIENNLKRNEEIAETKRSYQAELTKLADNKKEANERLGDENLSKDAREIYARVVQQAEAREVEINTKIKELETESRGLWDQSSENRHEINDSTKQAQELMGYSKNNFPEVKQFVKNEDFPKVAEYVEKMRQIKADAKEVLAKFDIDKLVEKVWEQIKSGSYPNQKDRNSSGSWIFNKYEYNIDLSRYNLGSKDLEHKLLANPLVVQAVIDKLFVKVQETLAQSKDHEDEASHQGHYAAHSEVNIVDETDKSRPKVKIWGGVGFGDKPAAYSVEASRLPKLPYSVELSDDQKQKIAVAVENPNIPLQELKTDLGFKYDPETVGRLQEDAEVENKEVDRKRELKKLEENIDRLKKDMERLQGTMTRIESQLGVLEKNFEYSKTERESVEQGNEVYGMQQELEKAKRDIANLPKGFLGGVKDKAKQRSLQETIDRIERDLPEKDKKATATKEKLEQIKQDLGKDFMKDYYNAGDNLRSSRSLLESYQRDLDGYKSRLDELEKRHAELEK